MVTPRLLFVIGASGVGKTAAVRALGDRPRSDLACHHFDSIGVPTVHEMVRDFGTPDRWQAVATHRWIARLGQATTPFVILEGQTRPSYIRAGVPDARARIVLLDCDPTVRSDRLRRGRAQPELDTPDMHRWAAYLRGQADALGLPIIDTTVLAPEQVGDRLDALVRTGSGR